MAPNVTLPNICLYWSGEQVFIYAVKEVVSNKRTEKNTISMHSLNFYSTTEIYFPNN